MVKWIVIAVVVLGVIILVAAALSVLGRLSGLERAGRKLERRRQEAEKLQERAAVLERSVARVQDRAELMQARLTVIKAGHGSDEKHSLQNP
ncbi:hypothetical protein [Actinoplanes sp. NPDC049118]|uniref:hypothetical protein n=1 Tax=Actinoplanes sp. NPDC049118 TaxID=3155769 RepID=UPI0033CD35D9